MNANWFPTSGVNGLRFASNLRNDSERRARVVVLGSFLGGYHVLSELIFGELSNRVQVVGIATDDPTQPYTNAKVRLWRHPHTTEDETLVRRFAASLDIPVFTGRVKSPEFHELMTQDWKPDLCLMATFGQKIPKHIIEVPRLGFFNFHHSGPTWPSYPGPDPIGDMQRDGLSHLVLTMHHVNEMIDDGEFFARSHPVAIPPGINAIEMHRISWPQMGAFIRDAVEGILAPSEITHDEPDSWTMHEDPVPYFAGEQTLDRARARRSADHCMAGLRASRILRLVASVPS
jgi:methionyl-tRNA formyltransferase